MGKNPYQTKCFSYLLLIITLLIFLIPQLYIHHFKTDDAYITFRYATRLADGHGLTFNPGERVEGFSNPLWTLLLSFFIFILPFGATGISHMLGLIFSLGTIYIIWWLFINKKSSFQGLSNYLLCIVLIFSNPGIHIYATAGLEGPMLMFLITFGIILTLLETRTALLSSAILFGLIGITRPEGILYSLLWFLFVFIIYRKKTPSRYFWSVILFIIILPVISYEVFRYFYYDSLIPNTGIAKQPGIFGEGLLSLINYIKPWIFSISPLLLLSLIKTKHKPEHLSLFRIGIGQILASAIFVAYAVSDWMPFGRFITPIWPLVAVLITVWLEPIINRLKENQSQALQFLVTPTICLVLLLSSLSVWETDMLAYIRNEKFSMLMRGTDQIIVGKWLSENIKSGTTVATGRLGGISYGAPDLIFWDTGGLTDKEEAIFISKNRSGGSLNDPILKRSPQIIATVDIPQSWSYKKDNDFYEWLTINYEFIRSFPQGKYGTFDIWIRKDSTEFIFKNNT